MKKRGWALDEQILVIDDDPRVLDMVRRELTAHGYAVTLTFDGETGLGEARRGAPDLIVLDLDLPGLDGLDVCRRLRVEGYTMSILMLTARDVVPDRIASLDAGADDCLNKPFAFDELLAHVRALLRRQKGAFEGQALRLADLVMNSAAHEVRRQGRLLNLTAREFALLELFLRHPRQVLTRSIIYDHVWGYDFSGESNIIEVYVRRLRTKLEAGNKPRLLQTVRGVGYVLREE